MHRPKNPARRNGRQKVARLRETRTPPLPSAHIIDADFTLVRKRRRLSWVLWSVSAALGGALAGFLLPPIVAAAMGL